MQKLSSSFEKFSSVEIPTPDLDEIRSEYESLSKRLMGAKDADEAIGAIKDFFDLEDQMETIFAMIYIRHSIDTTDEKYQALTRLSDSIQPKVSSYSVAFSNAILESGYLPQIEKRFGKLWIDEIRLQKKTFSPEIIPLLQKENQLTSEYGELTGGAQVEFQGNFYSLAQMGKFMHSDDRSIRSQASEKYWGWYSDNDDRIGGIYDDMVKVRTQIAKALGYRDFVGLGYDRMGRLDWDVNDIDTYREQVREFVVPLAQKIRDEQEKRLGFGALTKYYDFDIFYQGGNPKPLGAPEELVAKAQRMYDSMDSTTAGAFFRKMNEKGMFDLVAKKGKEGGGYEYYLPALKMPFIFSNFNGTSDDVDTLTHEFGHALQAYLGSDQEVPAYRSSTAEIDETHSMSMEFLTYPFMDLFFGKQTEEYRYMHLAEAITFIPYGTIVDAFQEYVYSHPEISHKERKAYWRKLELEFLPYRQSFASNEFLASGGFFERQAHIFENPFYYVDYTISEVLALEFFIMSLDDPKAAYDKYLAFASLGGTLPYKALLKKTHMDNPMVPPTLKRVTGKIAQYLDRHLPKD